MTSEQDNLDADWVSPPGETISDLLEERGWSQAEFARRIGYSEKHVSQLLHGKVPLTNDAAMRLERVLGSNAAFWLSREANFRQRCARLAATNSYASWVGWLEDLPVRELMRNGAIPKRRLDAANKPALVEACLRFFGVASPHEWRTHYVGMQAAFRRTRAEQADIGAISSWLRLGEQQAEHMSGPRFDRDRFLQALSFIRSLTCQAPESFEPSVRAALQECGVSFVVVPAIPRAHVSGVARWLTQHRPLVQLSLYGKTNDKFWFTLFHEAAHILLHSKTSEEKKSVFLDDPAANHATDPQELEANRWAGDWLIPPECAARLPALKSKTSVTSFAQEIGIHPGIVVGRMQHDGLIPPAWMNDLKASFRFASQYGRAPTSYE
jgi:HTH-type transcriptional regulator/antitoxin HigA